MMTSIHGLLIGIRYSQMFIQNDIKNSKGRMYPRSVLRV